MVREFEKTTTDNLVLVIDPWIPAAPSGASSQNGIDSAKTAGTAGNANLEEAISLAATICWDWCHQSGCELVLALADESAVVVNGLASRGLAAQLLTALALVKGTPRPDTLGLFSRLREVRFPPGPVLLVSTRPDSFRERLAAEIQRGVSFVEIGGDLEVEFYERPVAHAA